MLTKARVILKKYYGYDEFRPGQAKVIGSLLGGKDTIAIMPTGAGKSLCFQIPALLLPGITIVVSPLISLMKDQVDALTEAGIPATFINSSLSGSEAGRRLQHMRAGRYKLVYVAPERLTADWFLAVVGQLKISMLAIDEAHCVSQWGHDFRPSYRNVSTFIANLPARPVIGAFTATATPEVKNDIENLLALQWPQVHITGFDRPNLSFSVLRGENKPQFVQKYVKANAGQAGIIYAATRKEVDTLYTLLKKRGIAAGHYHAGLNDEERKFQQEQFLYDDIRVMVATNAFGMGIDKSNVRYVIHYNMPKNMESYYQEAGRSGRDGAPGECILLFGPQDPLLQRFLIDKSVEQPERKQHELKKLQEMVDYCHTPDCLRHYILQYFGEPTTEEGCGHCGNCTADGEQVDITVDAQKVFSCIYRLKERFGISVIADVLKGSKNKKVQQLGLDRLPTYGLMAERTVQAIKSLVQRLVATGYLRLTESEYPVVKLEPEASLVLRGETRVWQKVFTERQPVQDDTLFELLRQCRKRISERENVPPFVVFADTTLREMSQHRPQDLDAMHQIKGIGELKLQKYGKEFLAVITRYLTEHAAPVGGTETVVAAVPAKQAAGKKSSKAEAEPSHLITLTMYRQDMNLEEIAQSRDLTVNTVQNHLVRCAQEGHSINWDRLIPQQYEELIIATIKKIGGNQLKPIKEALPDAVSYAAIKAVLCKHFSMAGKA
ncbi:DNA helicase RecQ [Sporomusa acidovorans]|uniref:DNA helicase RecQ n=1 Tax=Sporomusa acidovorans (strain ATCC 49682 / DSM 3132 / Mol) TaxID=1123286 RepID=A0ABZ3J5L5_SPOA4|nr:DNA helicase RecQ [Sporomusa acidovorans]OZC15557.1 ATP-dependent DNA helicase RecQ [Sporomusa acidovorans DSM 3132]SDE18066.1 ATP-dependent DNA helicase, RecQ-like [Sporomusa acidovorans]